MLPFTASDDFCREVSRSDGAKEGLFSSSVSLLNSDRVDSGLICTYISSDVRWCNPRKQEYFFDIGWRQTSSDRATCVVQCRIQLGSMWRYSPNCGVKRRCCCSNSACVTTHLEFDNLCCVCAVCSSGFCPR